MECLYCSYTYHFVFFVWTFGFVAATTALFIAVNFVLLHISTVISYALCSFFCICSLVTVSRGFYPPSKLVCLMLTGTHTTYNYYQLLL